MAVVVIFLLLVNKKYQETQRNKTHWFQESQSSASATGPSVRMPLGTQGYWEWMLGLLGVAGESIYIGS